MIRIFYDKNLKTILIGNSKPIFPLLTSKTSKENLSKKIYQEEFLETFRRIYF